MTILTHRACGLNGLHSACDFRHEACDFHPKVMRLIERKNASSGHSLIRETSHSLIKFFVPLEHFFSFTPNVSRNYF